MSGHTPTPWSVHLGEDGFEFYEDDGAGNGDAISAIPGDAESEANCIFLFRAIRSFEKNQRTIAALVEALELVRPRIMGEIFQGRGLFADYDLAKIDAALSAAKVKP